MRTTALASYLLMIALLPGCAHGTEPAPSPPVSDLQSGSLVVLTPPNIDLQYAGTASATERVIRSQAELAELWEGYSSMWRGDRTLPDVDFDKNVLLYITVGQSALGWTKVAFLGVKQFNQEIRVDVIVTSPGTNCAITPVNCAPAALALLPKTDKSIVVSRARAVLNCEP